VLIELVILDRRSLIEIAPRYLGVARNPTITIQQSTMMAVAQPML
jgi:hypothetical protein